MLPFRDKNPSRRFPVLTVLIIALNVLAFFYQLSLGRRALQNFIFYYGVVPAYFWGGVADPFVEHAGFLTSTLISMFLHGGWFHLLGNMWYLWIFGDNIEDRLGRARFIVFYLLSGFAATLAHMIFNYNSTLPAIGASGAIAGVLGAYLITFPHARILTLVPFFFFWQIVELPALLVLGFWFIIQLFNGMGAIALTEAAGGVAWWAHIGGFIAGMVLMKLMAPRRYMRIRSYEDEWWE